MSKEVDTEKELDDYWGAVGELWFSAMRMHAMLMKGVAKRIDKVSDWIEKRGKNE